jgi:hypothetical protein
MSSTSQSRAAPRDAVLPGRSAAARWGRRKRRGQGVAAGVVAPKGRLNFLSARMLVAHDLTCRMPLGPDDRRIRTHHRLIATDRMCNSAPAG